MMDLVQIGSHAINLDRVAEIWDQELADGVKSGKVLVYFGDHCLTLEGDEAIALRRFVHQVARPIQPRPGPPKVTVDLSGLEAGPENPG